MNEQENGSREDGTKKELVYVQPADYPYGAENDEIDLADLVGVLVRRKWLIILGTLLIGILAAGAAFVQPEKFSATSLIEIGQTYNTSGGNYQKIESSEAVKNRIKSLGQAVGRELSQEVGREANPEAGLGFSVKNDFTIDIPEQGNIVTAQIEASKSSKALTFLNRVEKRLIKNHNRIFDQEKRAIQTSIHKLEIQNKNINTTIQDLKNRIGEIKRNFEARIGGKENKIEEIENSIDNLNARKSFLQGSIELLEQEKKELQTRIDAVENRYDEFLNSKLDANTKASESAAIGLMLFNSELQQMRKYRDQLRERLLFNIPEQISKLRTDLEELESTLQNRKAELDLQKKLLKQLEPEMKDKITNVQGQIEQKKNKQAENRQEIENLKAKLENMLATRVVLEPVYSENPVSANTKMFGALGVVLGLFLSVFAAFLIEFWDNNREKILKKQ